MLEFELFEKCGPWDLFVVVVNVVARNIIKCEDLDLSLSIHGISAGSKRYTSQAVVFMRAVDGLVINRQVSHVWREVVVEHVKP